VIETIQEGRSVYLRPGAKKLAAQAVSCSESEGYFRLASHTLAHAGVVTACNHAD